MGTDTLDRNNGTIIKLMRDQYITIHDIKIRYWDQGHGETLILLHGLGAFIETWQDSIEILSKKYRVIALDLPSSGKSDKKITDISNFYIFYADFLSLFMESLRIEKAYIMGHSAGAGIGIIFAYKYPQLVKKLVIISSSGLGREIIWAYRLMSIPFIATSAFSFLSKHLKLIAWFILRSPNKASRKIMSKVNEIYQTEESKRAILHILQKEVTLKGQKNVITNQILKKVVAPTLIIWGKHDPFVPFEHGVKATKYIPNSHLVAINSNTHTIHIENPQLINQIVINFLYS